MKFQPLIIASENKNKYDKCNELFYNCGTLGNTKSDCLLCLLLFNKNEHIKKQKLNFLYIKQSSFSTFETEQRDSLTFLILTFREGGVGHPAPLLPTPPPPHFPCARSNSIVHIVSSGKQEEKQHLSKIPKYFLQKMCSFNY